MTDTEKIKRLAQLELDSIALYDQLIKEFEQKIKLCNIRINNYNKILSNEKTTNTNSNTN